MQPILSFNDLTEHLKQLHRTFRLAVVCGSDASTAEAVMRAVDHGFAEAWFVGDCAKVKQQPWVAQYTGEKVHFVEADSDVEAAERAVTMVRNGGEKQYFMENKIYERTFAHRHLATRCA